MGSAIGKVLQHTHARDSAALPASWPPGACGGPACLECSQLRRHGQRLALQQLQQYAGRQVCHAARLTRHQLLKAALHIRYLRARGLDSPLCWVLTYLLLCMLGLTSVNLLL